MLLRSKIFVAALIAIQPLIFAENTTLQPGNTADVYHGETVKDPYRIFEDPKNPEAQSWIKTQDRLARQFARNDPEHANYLKQIGAIAKAMVWSPPIVRGQRIFFAEYEPTGPQRSLSLFVQDEINSKPKLLLDRNQFLKTSGETATRFSCSNNGRYVAVYFSVDGSIWETVRLFDVNKNTFLTDTLQNVHGRLSSINWDPDSSGFYYESYDRLADEAVGAAKLIFHSLENKTNTVVFDPKDSNTFLAASTSVGGKWLILSVSKNTDAGNKIWIQPMNSQDKNGCFLIDNADKSFSYTGQLKSKAWFRTDHNAPNGRIVAFDLTCSNNSKMQEIIPETSNTISTWYGFAPQGAVVAGEKLLVTHVEQGRLSVSVYTLEGKLERNVKLPYEGSIWSGFVGTEEQETVYYSLSGLLDPGSVYALNVDTGESTLVQSPKLPYNLENFKTEFVQVPARDGEKIPTFVVHRKDTIKNGKSPGILYGYGFGGWNAAPYFYPLMAEFVNRGGVWAVSAVRGDGGYGSKWHLAGRRLNKWKGIHDYLDVSRWLVKQNYTSSDRLIANASSAGGALVAAAVVNEPGLYKAVLLDYPLIDVFRYDRFAYAKGWIPEYGSSEHQDDYKVLKTYSPYHNLRNGICYPAIMLLPGENDGYTPPFHAYKFAAALQQSSSCNNPVLVRVSWGAGHSSGASVQDSVQNWADQLSFLSRVLPDDVLK